MSSLCFVTKVEGSIRTFGNATITIEGPPLFGKKPLTTSTKIAVNQVIPIKYSKGECKDCRLIGKYNTEKPFRFNFPVKLGPVDLGIDLNFLLPGVKIKDISIDVMVSVDIGFEQDVYCCGAKAGGMVATVYSELPRLATRRPTGRKQAARRRSRKG